MGESAARNAEAPAIDGIRERLSGRFRIKGMLPWGQSVPYFRATLDDRSVVVATLPVDLADDPETEAAFLMVAFDLMSLGGPGLPELVDHGVEGGMPYLAFAEPPGKPLADLLAAGPIASVPLLEVAEQVLEALTAAHAHELVHGEIVPENVLVAVDDGHPRVTLLGLGLQTLIIDARKRSADRSSGFAPARSAYRAPELLVSGAPTPASDAFSVGALIHHMVSGAPPKGWDTDAAYADIPALPEVVRQAMASDPADRYPSARDMRAALDWMEVESAKMNPHTQDIPLWMEHSVVGNIPVVELMRPGSTPPPPKAPPSARLPLPPRGEDQPLRTPSGLLPLPALSAFVEPTDEDTTSPSRVGGAVITRTPTKKSVTLPAWAQYALAAFFIAAVGVATYFITLPG